MRRGNLGRSQRRQDFDFGAMAASVDRTHLADDIRLLCDATSVTPQCFDAGALTDETLDCLLAHYLCNLRSHGARSTLWALPGADHRSKGVMLDYSARDAGLAHCALAQLYETP